MSKYAYKVVPAPARGIKVRGARTPEERFAQALQALMNDLGRDGWEYVRCDTLPSEERTGLTGRTTVYRNMLVFRREITADEAAIAPPAPMTLAARMAASLRPGTPAQPPAQPAASPAAPAPAAPAPAAAVAPPGDPASGPAPGVPSLGPADRGATGSAPRLVADRSDPDRTRNRPDGAATG